jgi:hypothetical protein
MTAFRTVTEKLRFPEGPAAIPDDSVSACRSFIEEEENLGECISHCGNRR